MDNELRRTLAIDTVDSLLADLSKSVVRGAAVFGTGELLTLITDIMGCGIGRIPHCGIGTLQVREGILLPYTGERRDLKVLLGGNDWVSAFRALSSVISRGDVQSEIKAGDFIRFPVRASAGRHDGVDFDGFDTQEVEAVVVHVFKDRIAFNFEDVLFLSAINDRNTNKGGFAKSALSHYLNEEFLDIFNPIKDLLAKNKDGNLITLPTEYEVFGNDDDADGNAVNWEEESHQLEYFKKIKNRIRVMDNDTKWWWLSTPNAADSATFAIVSYNGIAYYDNAGDATGGVAPAFCVR